MSQDWADAESEAVFNRIAGPHGSVCLPGGSPVGAQIRREYAQALREAYERGATDMRELAAAAAYSPLPDPSWPDVQAYRHGRAQAGAAIRALPASKATTK